MLQDLAVLTAGTVITDELGMKLEAVTLKELGQAGRVEVSKENTIVIDGAGTKEAISERVETIRTEWSTSESDYDKEKLLERIAKLSGGVAIIKVGAATEIEMKEKKDRVDDALHATRAAVEEGVVPGGGVALVRAKSAIQSATGTNAEQDAGIAIVLRAIEEPLRQIVSNAGVEPSVVINEVVKGESNYGFNAANDTYGDMIEMGVIDPTKVTRCAIQNAASVAGLLLTTDCAISNIPEENAGAGGAQGAPMGGMGGMPGMM